MTPPADDLQLPFMSAPVEKPPRKRLFIGLIAGSSILLSIFLLIGWIIPAVGFAGMHPSIVYISGALFLAAILVVAWSAVSLILQITTGKAYWGSQRIRGLTIKVFLPIMELLGKPFGIGREEVQRSFIKVNNQLTLNNTIRIRPDKVLILLPHCVQDAACSIRLSYAVDACKRCGKCPVTRLLQLRDTYGVRMAVATGGSIARRIVVETRPEVILAVACERDLTSGIQDTHPLPVFGILNHRPEGPCKNTRVDAALVEAALQRFIRHVQ